MTEGGTALVNTIKKRRGFTLVELLIAIIIIGILAGAMMLTGSVSTAAARAANIISDMNNIKNAILRYYVDNIDNSKADYNAMLTALDPSNFKATLSMYVDNPEILEETSGYTFTSTEDKKWYVVYAPENLDSDIQEKLKDRAKRLYS